MEAADEGEFSLVVFVRKKAAHMGGSVIRIGGDEENRTPVRR